MKRVAIATLGCKTNQFESASLIEQFEQGGYRVVPFTQPADIYVVNSCTVTAKTDAETRRLIRRARRLNPRARIVATGCYAQVAPGELEQMPEVDSVLGNLEKRDIVGLVEAGVNRVSDIASEKSAGPLGLESFAEHTRAFLQAQNGCDSFCAYCIVPYARGRSRSVPLEDVLQGVRGLAANGYREVVLTGIHLGAYGLDLAPAGSLTGTGPAHRRRAARPAPAHRLGGAQRAERRIAGPDGRVKGHLPAPAPAAAERLRQRTEAHGAALQRLVFPRTDGKDQTALPQAFIGADVIAGFPGESEEEFNETLQLVRELPFSDLHVFPYSSRKGTRAAGMPGQISPRVIKQRAELLRNCAAIKKEDFLRTQMGRKLDVLVQGFEENTITCNGISRNYVTVKFSGNGEMINTEQVVLVTGVSGEHVIGERV